MNKTISTLKLIIGWPLSLIALLFLIKLAIPKFSIVKNQILSSNPLIIILAIILFIFYFLLRSCLWKMILDYKGNKVSFIKTAYLWGFSEFKRYVPGNIWSFLSRISLFSDIGIAKKTLGLALLDEIQLIVVSSSLISLLALPLILNSRAIYIKEIISLSLIGIIAYGLIVSFIYKKRTNQGSFLSNIYLPNYSLRQKINLTILSILTFFVFGLATFIACLALTAFNLNLALSLSSFFVFALLIGYLSFITPMGLGVREGIVTIGLTPIVGLSIAGLLGIFSRAVLMISEISFLIIIFSLHKFIAKTK